MESCNAFVSSCSALRDLDFSHQGLCDDSQGKHSLVFILLPQKKLTMWAFTTARAERETSVRVEKDGMATGARVGRVKVREEET